MHQAISSSSISGNVDTVDTTISQNFPNQDYTLGAHCVFQIRLFLPNYLASICKTVSLKNKNAKGTEKKSVISNFNF